MKPIPILIVVLLLAAPLFCLWEDLDGPYYARIKAITLCRNASMDLLTPPIKLARLNRTHKVFKHNFTLPLDLTNEYTANVVIMSRGRNGYSWNSLLNATAPICDFIEKYCLEFTQDLFTSADHTYGCPIRKGFYPMKYEIPDIYCNIFPKIPVFPYGEYRMESSVYPTKIRSYKRVFCICFYFDIRPLYEVRGGCPRRIN